MLYAPAPGRSKVQGHEFKVSIMNYYLIRFAYEGWCQGPETMVETVLVKADTFEDAIRKIRGDYESPACFEDLTIE